MFREGPIGSISSKVLPLLVVPRASLVDVSSIPDRVKLDVTFFKLVAFLLDTSNRRRRYQVDLDVLLVQPYTYTYTENY